MKRAEDRVADEAVAAAVGLGPEGEVLWVMARLRWLQWCRPALDAAARRAGAAMEFRSATEAVFTNGARVRFASAMQPQRGRVIDRVVGLSLALEHLSPPEVAACERELAGRMR